MIDKLIAARRNLRTAIDARAERQQSAKTAEKTKARADILVQKTRAKLTRLGAEAKQAVERQAAAIRSGESGAAVSVPGTRGAQAELKQASATAQILNREWLAAQRAVSVSDAAVRDAAVYVMTLQADALADKLIEHRNEAAKLRDVILALTYVARSGVGDYQPWPATSKLSAALNWVEPQHPSHMDPVKLATPRWISYRDTLAVDADARCDLVECVQEEEPSVIRSVA